ncbi:MAG: acyltransferase family protein [Bacteroidales bacterium]|nr:acyltransferase family protein [Bacteroidales bacterium]MBP5383032.1 acyltransferase family protein [Bacteroidales bacterium]
MRKHWIDNLRWVTVLLVLLYHVIYFYNNKGVFGGIGGFGEYPQCPQYQDVLMYFLYPWFMPLLFILAGASARYALDKYPSKEWFKARTRKLLVPGTIGLFVFHWMVGYFNTVVADRAGVFDGVPAVIKYLIMAVSGTGPLWFIQVLWLLCIALLVVRAIDRKDKFWTLCGKANIVWIILLGVLFWLGEQTLILNPRPQSADGLLNLYKPLFYLVPFLLGYFVFSHDEVQEKVAKDWIPLMVCALISGGILIGTTFGQDNTSPEYLGRPLNSLYGWLMCLAMMGWFKAKFDSTSPFAGYMTRSSFGLYIVHYLPVAAIGYMMKTYTQLPPVLMYLILAVAVFTLSPLLYELIRRIPLVRWCVLGEKRTKRPSEKIAENS